MSLRPFFCYFGGKWRAAPLYPEPLHAEIVEPFAGAAGYATRYPDRRVFLFDKDPIIVGVWRYLIRASAAEILALPDVPLTGTVDDVPTQCAEQRWLIGFWLNGGSAQPKKRPGSWMRSTKENGGAGWTTGVGQLSWGARVRERLAAQVEKIRHWRVAQASYDEIPNWPATWFVDPPYQQAGKSYRHGSKDIDYRHLAAWCADRDGQTIVCENAGADWLPFEPFARIKASGGKARKGTSVEVIAHFPGTGVFL